MQNMEVEVILTVVGVFAIVALIGYFVSKAQEKRRQELSAFAAANGFTAYVGQGSGCLNFGMGGSDWPGTRLIDMFQSFEPFGTGLRPRAYHAVIGSRNGRDYYFFDYQYETESETTDSEGRPQTERTTHSFGVVAVRSPLNMRPLRIRPEGLFDKLKGALGFRDIQFESDEFNRRFLVSGEDPKFAYDLLHPRAMEYFMSIPGRCWQIAGSYILIHKSGRYSAGEYDAIMREIDGFLALVPEYVKQDIGFAPPWRSALE